MPESIPVLALLLAPYVQVVHLQLLAPLLAPIALMVNTVLLLLPLELQHAQVVLQESLLVGLVVLLAQHVQLENTQVVSGVLYAPIALPVNTVHRIGQRAQIVLLENIPMVVLVLALTVLQVNTKIPLDLLHVHLVFPENTVLVAPPRARIVFPEKLPVLESPYAVYVQVVRMPPPVLLLAQLAPPVNSVLVLLHRARIAPLDTCLLQVLLFAQLVQQVHTRVTWGVVHAQVAPREQSVRFLVP
jgi:hypothetical protein